MKNKLLALSLLAVSSISHAADIEYSLGLGSQYGGILGGQVALKLEDSKHFVGLGLLGASVGGKYKVSENGHHSIGFNLGTFFNIMSPGTDFLFGTYNYHFRGFDKQGWELGTGAGFFRTDEYRPYNRYRSYRYGESEYFRSGSYETETDFTFTINLGYTF